MGKIDKTTMTLHLGCSSALLLLIAAIVVPAVHLWLGISMVAALLLSLGLMVMALLCLCILCLGIALLVACKTKSYNK